MSSISHNTGFDNRHKQGKNMSLEADEETPLSATSLPNPSQIPSVTSNKTLMPDETHTIEPSHLTTPEKRLYDFLCSQGWTDKQCSCYFANIEAMKEALSHHFYSQGLSDDQVQAFHERCQMELPENFPAPRADADQEDLQMQLKLLEEMKRRMAIGERMYPSTRTMGTGIAEKGRT